MSTQQDSWGEVIINGMEFALAGPMRYNNLSVFPRKTVLGDSSLDSNPLLSAWVMSDLSGGHGVDDMNEAIDSTRYRLGTFYTRFPNKISKQYRINEVAHNGAWAAVGNVRYLGDVYAAGSWQSIISLANKVYSLTTPGTLIGTLPVNGPQGLAVRFHDNLFIPMGDDGYSYVTTTPSLVNRAGNGTTPQAQSFVAWDNKFYAIDTSGVLWWTIDPTSTWATVGVSFAFVAGAAGRLASYFDRNGNPTIFIMTDTEVLQFDPSGPIVFSVDVWFPFHPDNKIGMTKWNGDLYFPVYNGVHRYTGGSLSAIGLDRDSGLPTEYSGSIYDMVPGYNGMYVTVAKPSLSGFTFPDGTPITMNSLHEYTGAGWHMIWESDGASVEGLVRYSSGISRGGGEYRLYWGEGGIASAYKLYYIDLPRRFANPRERTRATGGFHTNGWIQTSIFDAGMRGYTKIANSLDVSLEAIDAAATLTVKYMINCQEPWYTLGVVTEIGSTHLEFGTLTDEIYPGVRFECIQFRYDLVDATNESFIMTSAVLSYTKLVPPSGSWTASLDLTKTHDGNSPEVMIQHLEEIMEAGVFVSMVHRGKKHRILVSQLSGSTNSGSDERGFRTVSLLEIPEALDTT